MASVQCAFTKLNSVCSRPNIFEQNDIFQRFKMPNNENLCQFGRFINSPMYEKLSALGGFVL